MCIEGQEGMMEEHELMILQKYKVPQLLTQQMVVLDGRIEYWFEITGKQQLTDYFSGKQIETEDIKNFLFSMEQLCRKLPEFLLKEERICLKPELLYVDLEDGTIYFTYLPFWNRSFLEEFRDYMEEMLKQINHQDRNCAELAYDIYEKTRRENVCIQELLNSRMWREPQISFERNIPKQEIRQETENVQESEQHQQVKRFELDRLKRILRERKESIGKELLTWVGKSIKLRKKKEKQELPPVIQENKCEREGEVRYPTEVLYMNLEKPIGKLIYQGKNGCRDLSIKGEEFSIGRSQGQVDGRIETEGISRMHARITIKEGDYYIEDLNSTNGTYLNEELLEYHRFRKLNRNDRVRFGVEEYVFC